MIFQVGYTAAVARQIGKLDPAVRERIRDAVERLRLQPEIGKRLKGLLADRWSYRVGNWRILYNFDRGRLVILVLAVGHRREVYRR
jgi:mRNA interferase RelE/StbE